MRHRPKILFIESASFKVRTLSGAVWLLELIRELRRRGWDAVSLYSGRFNFWRRPYLKFHEDAEGLREIELVNDPCPIPPYRDLSRPAAHCHNAEVEAIVAEVLETECPDLVHILSLRGFPPSIVDVVRKARLPLVRAVYDFWDLCPRTTLLYKGETGCTDYRRGEACVECLEGLRPKPVTFSERLRGATLNTPVYGLASRLKRLLPDWTWAGEGPLASPAESSSASGSDYESRRRFFLQKMNESDAIVFWSQRSRDIYVSYGVLPEKARVIPHTSASVAKVRPKPTRAARFPIVFGFLGGLRSHKGIHVLLDAFSGLDHSRCKLLIYGPKDDAVSLAAGGRNVEYGGLFEIDRINEAFAPIDVGVLPSIVEDTYPLAGLEFRAARIPMIGSRIGGIPELIRDGEDGFLVEPGSVDQLRNTMELFIKTPGLVAELQAKIRPPKTMQENAAEIEALYRELLNPRVHA